MPRKALGLRPVRETARRKGAVPPIHVIAYVLGDGTSGFTGDPHVAPTRTAGQRWWPHYRRATWARTHVGCLPAAAELFDALSTTGQDQLRSSWQHQDFDLSAVLEATEADRAAVRRFRTRDPDGAASIQDFLDVFLDHLSTIEAEARRIAASPEAWYRRGYPQIARGDRYDAIAGGGGLR